LELTATDLSFLVEEATPAMIPKIIMTMMILPIIKDNKEAKNILKNCFINLLLWVAKNDEGAKIEL